MFALNIACQGFFFFSQFLFHKLKAYLKKKIFSILIYTFEHAFHQGLNGNVQRTRPMSPWKTAVNLLPLTYHSRQENSKPIMEWQEKILKS